MAQTQLPIYFLKFPEVSTGSLNGTQPLLSNLLAYTEALPANIKAINSSNGTQLSITNFAASTETMSNTQHTNFSNKGNISNKSRNSTITLGKNIYNHKPNYR